MTTLVLLKIIMLVNGALLLGIGMMLLARCQYVADRCWSLWLWWNLTLKLLPHIRSLARFLLEHPYAAGEIAVILNRSGEDSLNVVIDREMRRQQAPLTLSIGEKRP